MSQSPREKDVEPAPQSPERNNEQEEAMSRHDDPADPGLYDFEVKEQDRWLPIANGE